MSKDGCGEEAGPTCEERVRLCAAQRSILYDVSAHQLADEASAKRPRDAAPARAACAEPVERPRGGGGHDARRRRPRSISSSGRLGRRTSIMLEVSWQLLHRNPRRSRPRGGWACCRAKLGLLVWGCRQPDTVAVPGVARVAQERVDHTT